MTASDILVTFRDGFALRFRHVVRRHYLAWRKAIVLSLLGHLIEPMIWLMGIGFGLGSSLPKMAGLVYPAFLGAGLVCNAATSSASYEGLSAAFLRWKVLHTWDGILHAPMAPEDIVLGEWIWAALKAAMAALGILIGMCAFGLLSPLAALWILPVAFLQGLAIAGIALLVAALVSSEDLHTYYFSLFLAPLSIISGVFFPIDRLPAVLQWIAYLLPLAHATMASRMLITGGSSWEIAAHLAVICVYAIGSFILAVHLIRKQVLQ